MEQNLPCPAGCCQCCRQAETKTRAGVLQGKAFPLLRVQLKTIRRPTAASHLACLKAPFRHNLQPFGERRTRLFSNFPARPQEGQILLFPARTGRAVNSRRERVGSLSLEQCTWITLQGRGVSYGGVQYYGISEQGAPSSAGAERCNTGAGRDLDKTCSLNPAVLWAPGGADPR